MKCDLFREAAWTAADGGLDPALPAQLDVHLAECAACRSVAERARRVTAGLAELRVGGPFAAPAGLRERTFAALDAAAPIGRLHASRVRRFAAPLALLAATLVVVIGWFQTRLGAPAPELMALRDDAPAAVPASVPAADESPPPGAPPAGAGGGGDDGKFKSRSDRQERPGEQKRSLAVEETLKSAGADDDVVGELDKALDSIDEADASSGAPGSPGRPDVSEPRPEAAAESAGVPLEGAAQRAGALPIEPARLLGAATAADALAQLRAALPRLELAKPQGRTDGRLGGSLQGRGLRGANGDTEKGGEGTGAPLDATRDDREGSDLEATSAAPTRVLFARLEGTPAAVAERLAGLDRGAVTLPSTGFLAGLARNDAARDGELWVLDLDEEEWLALEGAEALAPEAWFALQRETFASAEPSSPERSPTGGAKRSADDRSGTPEEALAKSRRTALVDEPAARSEQKDASADTRVPAVPPTSEATRPTKQNERRRVRVVLFVAIEPNADGAPARDGRD